MTITIKDPAPAMTVTTINFEGDFATAKELADAMFRHHGRTVYVLVDHSWLYRVDRNGAVDRTAA